MSVTFLETINIKKYYPFKKRGLFSKTTGWIKAVDGVNLSINEGETLGLVGESGCGKTTVSKLILMLEQLTSGSIFFKGKDSKEFVSEDFKQYRKSVQVVFQNPLSSLDPKMRVGQIIDEPLRVIGSLDKKGIAQRVAAVLEEVGLDPGNAQEYPHEFSGGQKQRIAIARALASEPEFIILDEPISSQDVSIRAQLMNLLKDLQSERKISYLFIAHDLAAVRYMSTVVNVMYLGKIVEMAPSDDLYTNPLHPYTKALLSASLPDDPDSKGVKNTISGDIPSHLDLPGGCKFHTRCPSARDTCNQIEPCLNEVRPGHWVSCLLYG